MRVLLDTNVLVEREDDHPVPAQLQQLLGVLNRSGVRILVHPLSLEELGRNGNARRRNVALTKVQTYEKLESPPEPTYDRPFLRVVGVPQTTNDRVDNALLYAVRKNAVGFLISEDAGLRRKAHALGLDNRVLSVEDALVIFRADQGKTVTGSPPALTEEPVHNLDPDDPFFGSLKTEYPEFAQWWARISLEGRKSWVYRRPDGSIGALLIYKTETEDIPSSPPIHLGKGLKLSTFKVESTGYKIGELFIKLSVQLCAKNGLDTMYLTHFTRPVDDLVSLIRGFGFQKVAVKENGEDVYLKKLVVDPQEAKNLSPVEISRTYYPTFYDGPRVRKFIVPIRPEYHQRLFTDFAGRQTDITEHCGGFIVEGNTIDKAYLSHSSTRRMDRGSVLLFYRSEDLKSLTSLGIVQEVFVAHRTEDILIKVEKRTVYTVDEIREMVKKPTTVVLFRWHFHFPSPVAIQELDEMGVLKAAPQSIAQIGHKKYLTIKSRGSLDERYTVN